MENLLIPTGSTLLNIACSGSQIGGFKAGSMVNLIGDSSSGKTLLALTMLAECVYNKAFKNHVLYYDDAEAANNFNIENIFGKEADKRIISPYTEKDDLTTSYTIEDFYYKVDSVLSKDKPCIYVLDSMDALSSEAELSKFNENKKLHSAGKDGSGSYGDGKAKYNSSNLRKIVGKLKETNSFLLIISQTRDNITARFNTRTRSGGNALKFYATHEIWMANTGKIVKTVRKKKRTIGVETRIKISKNKLIGKYGEVDLCLRYDYGIDDIAGNIQYLVSEGFWGDKKGNITSPEYDLSMSLGKWIAHIEQNNMEEDIKDMVIGAWKDVEEACASKRKRRFGK